MHQRKVSALAALVGSASLGLAMGCGNGAHHEPTAQRSLDGANDQQVARIADNEVTPAAEHVPMPAWLRDRATGDQATGNQATVTTALLTPPIARNHRQGDSLGEPPAPESLAGLAANTTPAARRVDVDEHRSGFRSAAHMQLVRTVSPDGYVMGTAMGRQLVADLAAPQTLPNLFAVANQPAVAEHPAATRDLRTGDLRVGNLAAGNDVNTLSIISTTSIAAIAVDTGATELEGDATRTDVPVTPIADAAVNDVAVNDLAVSDVALNEAAGPEVTEAEAVEPAETLAEVASVISPRDVPRLRADLRPQVHPLAAADTNRTSPHAKDSSAAAEALFGNKAFGSEAFGSNANSSIHSYDAAAAPSLIAIREVPSTTRATDAQTSEATADTPALAATLPVMRDAAQLHEPQPAPIVKTKPRVVVPIAQTPVVARRAMPQERAQNELAAKQLAKNNVAVRSDVTPKRMVTPVVAPHSSVKDTVARTIPTHRAPVQAAQPATRRPVSTEMLAVRRMADRHTFAGFDFASRRALYSAEAEFISSLRVLTRAADRRTGSKEHAVALADGITALEESVDFLASGSELEADFDVSMIVAGHRTSVLRGADGLAEMTPLDAVQQYYAFAQQRLADAVAGEPSGSFALYGLGKLHASLAAEPGANPEELDPKAMVYHQAALSASPVNYMAANELAVLLARYGQLDEARNLLLHSISIAPQPSTWHNLAMVHAQLGEQQLAAAASAEHSFAQKQPASNGNEAAVSAVQWLEPSEFSRTSDQSRSPAASVLTTSSTKSTAVHQTATSKTKSGGVFDMFKRK